MVKKSIKKFHTLRAGGLFVSLDNENKCERALHARGKLAASLIKRPSCAY